MTTGKGIVVIRVLALCSAIGLGGGYVWQRQKAAAIPAAPEPNATEDRSLMPGSKSMVFEGVEVPARVEVERSMIGSSKSGIIVLPGGKAADTIVIPGVPSSDASPPVVDPAAPPRQRTVLPGSKSISRILESPERSPAKPAPPTEPPAVEP